MTRHCEGEAAVRQVIDLHLHTTAEGFYTRLGWRVIGREPYEGEDVTIMTKRLAG